MRHRTSIALAGALLAGVLFGVRPSGQEAAPRAVLVITLDTTRADHLGCYGSAKGLTPNLDRLAAESDLFLHCETAVPQTVPSHTTIFSGWTPDHHGLRKNLETRISPEVPLVAEAFQKKGYATGAFVSSFVLLGRFGLGRGFDRYDDSFYDRRRPEESTERIAADTLDRAGDWIRAQKGPWFCWIHLYDPHYPYAPPPPYDKKFSKDPYSGEIAYMDAALGRFFKEQFQGEGRPDPLIVVCGDHGESLGEHGEEAHGIFLYEATTWVPLMIHLPGQSEGRKIPQTVGLVDVAPTLRDLCGLPQVPEDGVSLRPALEGKAWQAKPIYMEAMESLYSYGWAPLYGLAERELKFILAPRKELYRLDKDPHERSNLLPAEAAVARPMEAELKKRISDAHPASGKGMQLDQEELRSLQSLGYISGGPATPAAGGATKNPKDEIAMVGQYEEAVRLQQQGQAQESIKRLEALIKRSPGNPLFYYQLGRSLEIANSDKAVAAYKKAIQYRNDFPQPYIRLVWLLESQGKQGEAYGVAKLALKETADYTGEVHVLLAWAAFELGRPAQEVETALQEGAKIAGGDSGVALKLRALMALQKGDREGAVKYLQAMADAATPADVAMLGGDARFRELKDDPRFWTLVIRAQKQVDAAGGGR